MNWSRFVVRRPVAVTMAVLVVILLGIVSLTRLRIDLLPELELPMAAVITSYPGAGPEEIEKTVTRPLEDVLGRVQNVKNIRSMSMTGSSVVMLEFEWGTDMDFAALDMREKVDLAEAYLPDAAEKPMVLKMDPNMFPIITLAMHGDMDEQRLKDLAENTVKNRLERLEGVASVSVQGGLKREIQVIFKPERLHAFNLSLLQVVQALQSENLTFSGGKLEDARRDLLIRVTGEFKSLDDIRQVALALPTGGTVRLGEIADVRDYHADRTSFALFNGQPSIGLSIQKQTTANTVAVSREVKKALKELKSELPPGVVIETVLDQADFIQKSINSIYQDIILGSILAMLIIFIFLRNLRSTLIIGITIPISLISTFVLMYFGHMTLNLITLGGLSLGIGRMVDDAIVVLDNIYRHRQEGMEASEAAAFGAGEVTNAVVASTLTTVAVFLPISFAQGLASQIFTPMALTVFSALMASLAVALSVTPMLASKVFAGRLPGEIVNPRNTWQKLMSGQWFDRLSEAYGRFLRWSLGRRQLVLAAAVIIFILSLLLLPLVGFEFFPASDQGELTVSINLAKGTVLEETSRVADRVVEIIQRQPEVKDIYLEIGSSGGTASFLGGETPEAANIQVTLVDLNARKRSAAEVAAAIRKEVAHIPGAEITVAAASFMRHGISGAPVQIDIHGEDFKVLEQLAAEVKKRVETVPGAVSVKSSLEEGRPQVEVVVDRERAAFYNLGAVQIGNTVAAAIQGKVATRYRVGGDEYDLRVRLEEASRQNLSDLENLTVPAPTGVQVPLKEVARLRLGTTPSTIERYNQDRVASVTADLQGRPLGEVMGDIRQKLADMKLPSGYYIDYTGETQQMMETFGDLSFVLIVAILLVYMIMAAQFESLLYPFVIMFAIPLSLIGVVLALLITGRHFGITAFIGVIMLTGIVLANAIVLVDFINILRQRGIPRLEAIVAAGKVRLQPILMTALTTILAMLPIAIGIGEGAELQSPMATAVIGGLLTSTVLTLVVVPVIYTVLEDVRDRILRRRRGSTDGVRVEV
ncbi:MAG: hydrophobic/amphiphilic exporter (mainly bacteria), family [Clostridia bacterium]|nr:hydrophobic/amphiphilic exporter (mainly bacteria), family [Clostridia bacterium]